MKVGDMLRALKAEERDRLATLEHLVENQRRQIHGLADLIRELEARLRVVESRATQTYTLPVTSWGWSGVSVGDK